MSEAKPRWKQIKRGREFAERAAELYAEGLTAKEVGARLGYTAVTVLKYLRKHGVQIRGNSGPRGRKNASRLTQPRPAPAPQPAEAVPARPGLPVASGIFPNPAAARARMMAGR